MNKKEKQTIKENKKLEKIKRLEEKSRKKAQGFLQEFKKFATKGNVLDMAIGVIIASAFTKIVNSLVADIITPTLSLLTGKIDFSNLFVALDGKNYTTLAEATEAGVSVISYGTFISNIINFLMVALSLFIFLKVLFKLQNLKKKEEIKEEKATTKKCPYCLNEIHIDATKCGHCTSSLEESK